MKEHKYRAMIKDALYLMPVVLVDFANGVEVEDIGDDRVEHYFYEWDKVEALEQYTGLHDKNGKEIYEGDICHISGIGEITVVWCESTLGYIFTTERNESEYDYQDLLEDIQSLEIIGNIHEKEINK